MGEVPKRWTVASARQHLTKLLSDAAREPQAVYRRDKLVATVVNPEIGREVLEARAAGKSTMAAELEKLRQVFEEENYELEVPARTNRPVAVPKRRTRRR